MHHFHVPGMNCGGCLRSVTRAIHNLDPQAGIESNLETRDISVNSDRAEAALLQVLKEAGYPAHSISPQDQ